MNLALVFFKFSDFDHYFPTDFCLYIEVYNTVIHDYWSYVANCHPQVVNELSVVGWSYPAYLFSLVELL